MLLTETLNVSDEALRQKHNLPVVLGDTSSNLGARDDAEGHRPSPRLTSKGRKVTPLLFTVTLTDHPRLRDTWSCNSPTASPWTSRPGTPQSQDGEKQRPFVFLDRTTLVGVGPLYASSGSHLIVKLARAPKKDKSELER